VRWFPGRTGSIDGTMTHWRINYSSGVLCFGEHEGKRGKIAPDVVLL
jgi:hypothetical protein